MTVREQFRELILEHSDRTGFTIPELLTDYLSDLLATRLQRVDLIPDPSFAERYLLMYQRYDHGEYKDYADSALFFCSLMPQWGQRRGISMDYYATLGISTYYALGDLSEDSRYTQLGNWFYHLQRFLDSAIHRDHPLRMVSI